MGWQRETGRQAEGGLNPFSHSRRKRFREVNGASFLLDGKYPMCYVSEGFLNSFVLNGDIAFPVVF